MNADIENKYQALLKRIDRKPKQKDEAQSLLEQQDARVKGGHDAALKGLYDKSVFFKNDLADLRSRIKELSTLQSKYDQKCETFGKELNNFGSKNEMLQLEREKLEEIANGRTIAEKQLEMKDLQRDFLRMFNK